MRRRSSQLAVFIALGILALAPPAAAASQIGWDGIGNLETSPPCPPVTYTQAVAVGKSYFVPIDGVISSFAVQGADRGGVVQFELFRYGASSSTLFVVANSERVAVQPGMLNSYDVRIPARAGDLIGMAVLSPSFSCLAETANSEDWMANVEQPSPPSVGSTVGWSAGIHNVALNLRATVEPDADGDGWGDETQDRCVGVPGPEHGCPIPLPNTPSRPLRAELNLSGAQDALRRGGVGLALRANQPAAYTASGVLRLPGSEERPAIRQTVGQIGADSPLRLKLKLTRRAERTLRKTLRVRPRAGIRIQVDVRGQDGREVTLTSTLVIQST